MSLNHYIFEYFFLLVCLTPPPWHCHCIYVGALKCVPHFSEIFFVFICFICSSGDMILIIPSSSLMTLLLAQINADPLFRSRFPFFIISLLIFYIHVRLSLYLLYFFKHGSFSSFNKCIMAALKILSAKCNISALSKAISIFAFFVVPCVCVTLFQFPICVILFSFFAYFIFGCKLHVSDNILFLDSNTLGLVVAGIVFLFVCLMFYLAYFSEFCFSCSLEPLMSSLR